MNVEQMVPLEMFSFEGEAQTVLFVETMHVTDGVDCDAYIFIGDTSKDLGVIKISLGGRTPLQRVLKGEIDLLTFTGYFL